jgi:hypothetical protein
LILENLNAFGDSDEVSQRLYSTELETHICNVHTEIGPEPNRQRNQRERLDGQVVSKRKTRIERVTARNMVGILPHEALYMGRESLRWLCMNSAHYVG